jgi:hypothetical protein
MRDGSAARGGNVFSLHPPSLLSNLYRCRVRARCHSSLLFPFFFFFPGGLAKGRDLVCFFSLARPPARFSFFPSLFFLIVVVCFC